MLRHCFHHLLVRDRLPATHGSVERRMSLQQLSGGFRGPAPPLSNGVGGASGEAKYIDCNLKLQANSGWSEVLITATIL